MNIFNLPIHPAAELFPPIAGSDFDSLKRSIQHSGQLEPVKINDGYLVDGRNRLRACEDLGIEPRYEAVQTDNVVQYVIAINLERRHLTTNQRAHIAADLANMEVGINQFTKTEGGPNGPPLISIAEAAEMMNVGERTIKRAKKMAAEDPEAHELAKQGKKPKKSKKPTAKKPKHSWIRIAIEEGLMEVTAGGERHEQIKKELKAINPWNPDLFKEPHAAELRKACINLRLQRDPELANATKAQVDNLRASLTEKEEKRVDKAIRLAKKSVDYEIQTRVTKELNEILPEYNREYKKYQEFNNAYEGVMTRKEYRKLLSVLHSDRIQDEVMKRKFDEVFTLIKHKELVLCGHKESEKTNGNLPTNVADLMAKRKSRA